MNLNLLSIEVQQYLHDNAKQSPTKVALRKSPFEGVSAAELAEQVDTRQRLKNKLPHWIEAENPYFPPRQNAEQCSSEQTALYKANLVIGKVAIDLTGGFGVDVWALSQYFETVDYCEINASLFPIVAHNFKQLQCTNVECHLGNGLEILENSKKKSYDLIYLDPARRDEHNRKMVSFGDCVPNVIAHKELLFQHSHKVMIKASPMMDISLALKELSNVKEVHVVALKNECKELLFILEKEFMGEATIHCVNLPLSSKFTFKRKDELASQAHFRMPSAYLYEPNAAILKAGAFNSVSEQLKLDKLHSSTHLYTSDYIIQDFPGKTFRIIHNLEYNKKIIRRNMLGEKINIKTFNFTHSPQLMQKKLGVKDGGDRYLFGVKTMDDKYRILITEKV